MLALSDPSRPLRRAALDTPGGFAWWYVDLIDANGDGAVLIWSFGLPFLPGYRSAVSRGTPVTARIRPSLNVTTWRDGRPDFYLLQEWPAHAVCWEPNGERVTFGDTTTFETAVRAGRRRLIAHLDVAVPGTRERLTGCVEVSGAVCRPPTERSAPPTDHTWTPLTTATRGRVVLQLGDRPVCDLDGRAYHDRNESVTPLDRLGIGYWVWGRTPVGDGEVIHYLLWPEDGSDVQARAWFVGADGAITPWAATAVEPGPRTSSRYGMRHHPVVRVITPAGDLVIRTRAVLDDGPFYLRMLTEVDGPTGSGRGIGEAILPDRVDLPVHRPFVRMRVHDLGGANSIFLPLFTGPAEGRVRRWLAGSGPALAARPAT